ncbi:MAG: nuclear transport factor 2 family protein [Pseudomonadota bacterium]
MGALQQKNTALLREAWARWHESRGTDLAMWYNYMARDVRILSLADGGAGMPYTTARRGHAALDEYLTGLTTNFTMDHWTIDETVAEGDRVVGIGSTGWTHRASGRSFDTPVVIVTTWADGKITDYREFYDTAMIAATAA